MRNEGRGLRDVLSVDRRWMTRTHTKLTRDSHETHTDSHDRLTQTHATHTDSQYSHALTRTHTDSHPLTCRWWEDWREILSQTSKRARHPCLTGVGAIVVSGSSRAALEGLGHPVKALGAPARGGRRAIRRPLKSFVIGVSLTKSLFLAEAVFSDLMTVSLRHSQRLTRGHATLTRNAQ